MELAESGSPHAVARIAASSPTLKGVDRRLADAVASRAEWIARAPITEVAADLKSSPSSVLRSCRRLGFGGFDDLKFVVAQDIGRQAAAVLKSDASQPPETTTEILDDVLRTGSQSLIDALTTIDSGEFSSTVDAAASAGRILLVAAGTSCILTADLAQRLTSIGLDAYAPADHWNQQVIANQLSAKDLCIAVSRTGSNEATIRGAKMASSQGATTVAVTCFNRNPLTNACTHAIVAGAADLAYHRAGMASQLAILAVFHALYVAVAAKRPAAAKRQAISIAEVTAKNGA